MDSFVNYNGKIYHENIVPVNYKNRAFKYGDSFFETIRTNGQHPICFPLHYKRIRKAMISLKMDIASIPTEKELYDQIVKLIHKHKIFEACRVRIEFFRAGEGLYTPTENTANFLIEISKLHTQRFELNTKGLLVSVFSEIRKAYNPVSYFKCGNALHYILAALQKKEDKVDDCLLINDQDKIIEASSSNLFWIKKHIVYTASVFSGCVDGTMRQTVIQLIKNSHDLQLEECNGASVDDLLNADEIFITNAIQGIQWIVGFNDRRYFNYKTKELVKQLNNYIFESTN